MKHSTESTIKYKGSHDIAHCDNDKCSNNMTCRRYLAHLDAMERNLDYLSYFVMDKEDQPDCTSYWPYN